MTVLLVSFAIIAVAAATYGLTGFGFALVAIPLLAVAIDARTAVVAVTLDFVVMAAVVAVRERGSVYWPAAIVLFATSLAGMPFGLLALVATSERLLTGMIAVCVLVTTFLMWRGMHLRDGRATVATAGVISGVLATSTGTAGPPVVVAFQAMGYDPASFRATLSAVFTAMSIIALGGFLLAGQVGNREIAIGLVGLPAMLAGWACGNALFRRVEAARFRQLVLSALVVTAVVTMMRAITG